MVLDLASLFASGILDQAAFDAHSEFAEIERERDAKNERLLEKIKSDARRPVGFAAVIERRRPRGRRPLTSKSFGELERRWHQRRHREMKKAIEAIADKRYPADEGGLPSAISLRLHLLILDLQKSHSLRKLAPRPRSVFDRWASIEEGASRNKWCDHDAEEHVRNAMRLAPVPSGQLLLAVLGNVRELLSLSVELSRSAQIESKAILPREKGGCVSPLLGSLRQQLADGLLKMILDTLGPERCEKMSGSEGGPYDRLLKAVGEYATGEKPQNDSFSDARTALPSARDKLVNRPGPEDRREMAAAARADKAARKKAAREKAEDDQTMRQLAAMDPFDKRRILGSIAHQDQARATRLTRDLDAYAAASPSSADATWVRPLSAIKSG